LQVLLFGSTCYLKKMELIEAQQMIKDGVSDRNITMWADLGCGKGIFTNALGSLLRDGSRIHAIDKYQQNITSINPLVPISFEKADFKSVKLVSKLDGILMANSLHYVKRKTNLIKQLIDYLSESGRIIVVEYDTMRVNPWVPYPISFNELKKLCLEMDFKIAKLNERLSQYGGAMYSALLTKTDKL